MDARSTFDGEWSLGHSCSYLCRVLAERDRLRVGRDSFSVREQALTPSAARTGDGVHRLQEVGVWHRAPQAEGGRDTGESLPSAR